ncbi:hypothetical protein COCON_G00011650 [Conger conger]|uniref:Uncharacterized protein n=1 Tax=Conger conger TaxID=82655 RepID=A0A9Q1E2J4_CONCO|nr:hypothetical protein COCON_G00011650 [Conger conger]
MLPASPGDASRGHRGGQEGCAGITDHIDHMLSESLIKQHVRGITSQIRSACCCPLCSAVRRSLRPAPPPATTVICQGPAGLWTAKGLHYYQAS